MTTFSGTYVTVEPAPAVGGIGWLREQRSGPLSARRPRLAAAMLVALAFPLASVGVSAQEGAPGATSSVLDSLEGCWVGSGVLLGRPASFGMSWEVEASFVYLIFTNAWIEEDGRPTPVLSARGTIRRSEPPMVGVWIDDRPDRLWLEATVTDSSLVTHWRAETEEGRTEYVVRSPNVVRVHDIVFVDDGERTFGEATYQRAEPSMPGACPGR